MKSLRSRELGVCDGGMLVESQDHGCNPSLAFVASETLVEQMLDSFGRLEHHTVAKVEEVYQSLQIQVEQTRSIALSSGASVRLHLTLYFNMGSRAHAFGLCP